MRQLRDVTWDRLLSVFAVCFSLCIIGILATALENSLSAGIATTPPKSAPESGVSLLALIYVLLNAALSLLGITLEKPDSGMGGVSVIHLLVAVFQILYQYRLYLLGGVALFAVIGLVTQYRHQITSTNVLPPTTDVTTYSETNTIDDWPPDTTSDAIQQAWVDMIRKVNVENPSSRTAREWQTAAIEGGANPEAVRTITTTLEEVQYGTAPVTSTRKERVRTALKQLHDDWSDAWT